MIQPVPETIDVRYTLQFMVQRWYVLLLAMVVCVASGVGTRILLYQPSYSAAALVIIEPSAFAISPNAQVVPYFNQPPLPLDELAPIAMSDDVLSATLAMLPSYSHTDPDTLRKSLDITQQSSTSSGQQKGMLLQMHVNAQSASDAAAIANTWAKATVSAINAIYQGDESGQLTLLRSQRDMARAELNELIQKKASANLSGVDRELVDVEIEAKREGYRSLNAAVTLYESGMNRYFEMRIAAHAIQPLAPDPAQNVLVGGLSALSGLVIGFAVLLVWSLIADPINTLYVRRPAARSKSPAETTGL